MATKDRDRIRKLREEANALRLQEEARKRRSRMFAQVGIVLGAIVVIGLIVLLVVMGPRWFGNQNTPESTGTVPATNSAGETVEVPIQASGDGVLVGDPDAPTVIDYYYDFSCPHCVDYHAALGGDFQQVIADGDAQVNFHIVRFVSEYGLTAGATVGAVLQHQPELYFDVVDGIFAVPAQTQANWSYADYAELLPSLGVTSPEAIEATANGDYASWVNDQTDQARRDGIPGTPTVMIDGEIQETLPASGDELRAIIGASSADAPADAPAEAPAETPAP